MARWAMAIDLDRCTACQACVVACQVENNVPPTGADEAKRGRAISWMRLVPMRVESAEGHLGPEPAPSLIPVPCMHCENPPCIKVCPVQATYKDEEGLVRQNYDRCIGCRFCTVGCPYGVRYFNWYEPEWVGSLEKQLNPDVVMGNGILEGPAVRPKGVVEKCTFCIQRLRKARQRADSEGRDFRPDEYVPACVQTCTGKARFFGDLDDPESTVSLLSSSQRAFRLLEDVGTHPKVIYLKEG